MPREWYVSEVLKSFRRLNELLTELTVEELEKALEIEHGTRRRRSMISRLTARISVLNRNKLKKEYT